MPEKINQIIIKNVSADVYFRVAEIIDKMTIKGNVMKNGFIVEKKQEDNHDNKLLDSLSVYFLPNDSGENGDLIVEKKGSEDDWKCFFESKERPNDVLIVFWGKLTEELKKAYPSRENFFEFGQRFASQEAKAVRALDKQNLSDNKKEKPSPVYKILSIEEILRKSREKPKSSIEDDRGVNYCPSSRDYDLDDETKKRQKNWYDFLFNKR
ncbi:MAG: hypothetical protein COU31_04375 [Candidatus Magasanikbacteria bacterium CG10_big_fil_rev_8_21_14_0_10_40_10]|uniref:Uncharacterized protein n=1 Tax=Candidatus Magasanikbacteria bacterium CG10_big_fil_rev_8_21_14_0_10_40_10 TaxID=1974648 RepID=A0A2M6W2Z9_9BACT|nr:MAG: hypothetical protein COU31_04375 [Candidatus Magasanikbacteria bacterium CG10_big_fil_rev_8_21_14_0_10_40_10]